MKRKIRLLIGTCTLLSCLSAWPQDSAPAKSDSKAPQPQASPSYVTGPDDTLYISVWKEPELTNNLPVRADGMISMPLLNDVQAAGLTPMQLSASITEKLRS